MPDFEELFPIIEQYVDKSQIIMGFQPGDEQWEGSASDMEVIKHI